MTSISTFKCATESEAVNFLHLHEQRNGIQYVVASRDKLFGTSDWSQKSDKKIIWQAVDLPFDGIPSTYVAKLRFTCRFGAKRPSKQCDKGTDHAYNKKYNKVMKSHKVGCTAKATIKQYVRFKTFAISENSKHRRQTASVALREAMEDGSSLSTVMLFVVHISAVDEHKAHNSSSVNMFCQKTDSRVLDFISKCCDEGVTDIAEMRRHLKHHLTAQILCRDIDVSTLSSRYWPGDKSIFNAMYRARARLRQGRSHEDNASAVVASLALSYPTDILTLNLRFDSDTEPSNCDNSSSTPVTPHINNADENLLFFHQTQWQRRLLELFGRCGVLIDCTYNTTCYDIPLLALCVRTNVGFVNVATCLIYNETTESIQSALRTVALANPGWKPDFFVSDFNESQLNAINAVFPDTRTFLCAFHRRQAWDRRLKGRTGGKSILKRLQSAADAVSEAQFTSRITELMNSDEWKAESGIDDWFRRKWLPHKEKWAYAYSDDLMRFGQFTTNGLERQHQTLKYKYLSGKKGGCVSDLINVIVTEFVPACQRRFLADNAACMKSSTTYSSHVPSWLQFRPRIFTSHCMDRLRMCNDFSPDHVVEIFNGFYHVFSPSADDVHEVLFSFEYKNGFGPRCNCRDWRRTSMLCKHILAVIQFCDRATWNSLPSSYRQCPLFNLYDSIDCVPVYRNEANNENSAPSHSISSAEMETMQFSDVEPSGESSCTFAICQLKNSNDDVRDAQFTIRQQLAVITNATYNVQNLEVLQSALENLRCVTSLLDGAQVKDPIHKLPMRIKSRTPRFQAKRTKRIRKGKLKLHSVRGAGKKTSSVDTGSFSRCSGVKRCKSGIFADTGNSHRDHSASALGSVHEELSASTVSRTAAMPHDRSAVTEVERQPAASHQQGCRGNALSSDVAYEEYVHTSSTLQATSQPITGLVNIGNTCYLNAVLQTLYSMCDVRIAISVHTSRHADQNCIPCTIGLGFNGEASHLRNVLSTLINGYQTGEMQDAHELFVLILDAVHQCSREMPELKTVNSALNLSTVTQVSCNNCEKVRITEDTMAVVSIALEQGKDPVSLQTLVDRHVRQTEDIAIRCDAETCRGNSATLSTTWQNASVNLVIHIKRWCADGRKCNRRVKLSNQLVVETNAGTITYSLSSVLLHVGTSGHDGHYQAVVLCGDQWKRCNDHKISDCCVSAASVERSAYICTYSKSAIPVSLDGGCVPATLQDSTAVTQFRNDTVLERLQRIVDFCDTADFKTHMTAVCKREVRSKFFEEYERHRHCIRGRKQLRSRTYYPLQTDETRFTRVVDAILDLAIPVMASSITTPYGANVRAWKETSLMPVVKGALLHEAVVFAYQNIYGMDRQSAELAYDDENQTNLL